MIELALAGLIAFASVPAASPEPMVEQVQFRGGPGGQCPDGYDFNHSNGRCYPNDYHAPGYYTAPQPTYRGRGYYRGNDDGPEYYGRGGRCPDGYDYNYSNGQCFPNGARAPGMYLR
ncbi:hypothetical protein ACRQ5Q_21105 [Bradyrhizobium sp. PMVTL-01]|uniref:hypothetical protein n=1 Tax=Bradyrhizobium sp. PMVTL-01 TaxID=3434999 RepID=UPI003F7041E2